MERAVRSRLSGGGRVREGVVGPTASSRVWRASRHFSEFTSSGAQVDVLRGLRVLYDIRLFISRLLGITVATTR